MRVPAWPGSVEGSFFGLQTANFLYFHKVERQRALWPLLIRTLIPFVSTSQAQMVKNLPGNAGYARDAGSIPGSGRSPGEENGNPL